MTEKIIKATEVLITPEAITIHWEDGQTCVYEHRKLRLNCRCAGCIGEWPNRTELDPAKVPEDVQAVWPSVAEHRLQPREGGQVSAMTQALLQTVPVVRH